MSELHSLPVRLEEFYRSIGIPTKPLRWLPSEGDRGIVALETGRCNCGTVDDPYPMHERGCGLEPFSGISPQDVEEIVAWETEWAATAEGKAGIAKLQYDFPEEDHS